MRLTEEQKLEIIDKYNTGDYNGAQLAREYGAHTTAINAMLHRRGVQVRNNPSVRARKYPIEEDFFDIVDSEEKAYFLGILYADGTVSGTSIMLSLQEPDREILEKLKDLIQPTKPILWYKSKNPKRQNTVRLTITNQKMKISLENLGIVRNKTFKIKFPDFLDESLIRHFIRGYLDGDGNINFNGGNCSIIATLDFCETFRDLMFRVLGVNCGIIIPNKQDKLTNIRRVTVSGRNQSRTFLNWIYKDAKIYMERKYQSYLKLVNFVRGSHGKPRLIHPNGTKFTEDEKRGRANAIRRGDYSFDFLNDISPPKSQPTSPLQSKTPHADNPPATSTTYTRPQPDSPTQP